MLPGQRVGDGIVEGTRRDRSDFAEKRFRVRDGVSVRRRSLARTAVNTRKPVGLAWAMSVPVWLYCPRAV